MTADDIVIKSLAAATVAFEVDPLACALAQRNAKFIGIELISLEDSVTKEHLDEAKVIREYYLKKYFWAKLQGFEPSEFKSNVTRLLSIDKEWSITDRDIGLFVRLVDFYAEDTTYDRLQKSLNTREEMYEPVVSTKIVDLEYVCQTYRAQASQKAICYWFKDTNNLLYQLKTKKTPYSAILEKSLTGSKQYVVSLVHGWTASMHFYDIKRISETVL